MSAGTFARTKYQANNGDIYPIRLQPETLELTIGGTANSAPAGATTERLLASVSKGNREYGVKPRRVGVKFSAAPPVGYKPDQIYYIPILGSAFYGTIAVGATGIYLGVAVDVVSLLPELIK